MIDDVLRFILGALNAHLEVHLGRDPEPYAILSALVTPDGRVQEGIEQRVILTVVNLERETSAGVASPRTIRASQDGLVRVPSPMNLNVYLLMSSHHTRYLDALKRLSIAIGFAQANPSFDTRSAAELPDGVERLTLEMVSLDFQALNNLWASNGSKYLPSVVLKLRMLSLDQGRVDQRVPVIRGLDTQVAPGDGAQ